MGNRIEDVRTLILSLLLARKGATPVPVLERDYYEEEKKRIPYRQFGYTDLVQFLQSMPDYFIVDQYNGGHYVRGIASEKSKHVSSLVSRQKVNFKPKYIPPHARQFAQPSTFNRRSPRVKQVILTSDKLYYFMQYVKNNPNGVSLQNAVMFVQQLMPYITISQQDLLVQLYELSHQLRVDGNMIYPVQNNNVQDNVVHRQPLLENPPIFPLWNESKSPSDSASPPIKQTVYAAGQEDDFDWVESFNDENDFVPASCKTSTDNCQKRTTSEQIAMNCAQYFKCGQTDMFNCNSIQDDMKVSEDNYFAIINNNTEINITECPQDKSDLVNDRIKSRLEELLKKHPNGIWCAELPDKYLQEYKVPLGYAKLGFTSVREFTSYLPKIFYMTQVSKTDDFKLYSADKRPVVPKTEPSNVEQASYNSTHYDEHATVQADCINDSVPIPPDVSSTITKSFAPNDVMNYNDDVNKILVTDLKRTKKFLEIYVVEVFHPSFFWIHLRENKIRFNKMMDELFEFYELNKNAYTIAKVALTKDLNCACVYAGRWHRGIIKNVKADFRVTVLFYDYGTLKTYSPEDVYYLHKKFSFLPAQAIPCSLYDVKPSVSEKWKKSVIDQFIDKIADTLLAATIVTIDPLNNSMMVILTDTSEEEDVCINDWLVKERLAQVGNLVRINDIIQYLLEIEPCTSIRIFHEGSAVNVNKSRQYINQLCDERTHKLSDIKSEDVKKKTFKSLHNVSINKKELLQMMRSKSPDIKSLHGSRSPPAMPTKSPDTESSRTSLDVNSSLDTKLLDIKSESSNSQSRRSRTPRELISLLEKIKTSRLNETSNSNPNTSTFEENTDNENDVRQIDSSREIEMRNNNENCYVYMDFSLRDSDDDNDQNDFGTFRSLYGGRGLMEPIDWSVIREENNLPRRTTATLLNDSDLSIKEYKSDVEDKSKSHDQRNELPGKQYFLNLTSLEKEDFLPENNIDYDIENKSDFIEMLKNNKPDHTVTVIFTPNVKFKTLHDNQSEDTSNSNIDIVKLNDITSSREMDQKVDGNGKVCNGKTRVNQKTKSTDSTSDSESVFSNITNNKDNINRKISECSTNSSLQSNTNKVNNPRYYWKMLLDKMKCKQMDSMNSSSVNTSKSSSSEQIPISSSSCDTTGDTIISSNDEQSKASNVIDTITYTIDLHKEPTSEKLTSKKLTLDELRDSEETKGFSSSETDSSVCSIADDTKQHRLNQSSEIDSIVSSNADDIKQHRLNQDSITSSYNVDNLNNQMTAGDQTLDIPEIMQRMLKIVQNIENSELDSDDLSQGSFKDNKSDESKEDDKSDCMSETCESMNDDANVSQIAFAPPVYNDYDVDESKENDKFDCMSETCELMNDDYANVSKIASTPPVYNDCYVESDESEWDYAGFDEDFLLNIMQKFKMTNY